MDSCEAYAHPSQRESYAASLLPGMHPDATTLAQLPQFNLALGQILVSGVFGSPQKGQIRGHGLGIRSHGLGVRHAY